VKNRSAYNTRPALMPKCRRTVRGEWDDHSNVICFVWRMREPRRAFNVLQLRLEVLDIRLDVCCAKIRQTDPNQIVNGGFNE
jgi:hypothetical protein